MTGQEMSMLPSSRRVLNPERKAGRVTIESNLIKEDGRQWSSLFVLSKMSKEANELSRGTKNEEKELPLINFICPMKFQTRSREKEK